jgi:hypothetical protein
MGVPATSLTLKKELLTTNLTVATPSSIYAPGSSLRSGLTTGPVIDTDGHHGSLFQDHLSRSSSGSRLLSPERLDRAARVYGFRKEVIESVADSNGRLRFEIFLFVPSGRGAR